MQFFTVLKKLETEEKQFIDHLFFRKVFFCIPISLHGASSKRKR